VKMPVTILAGLVFVIVALVHYSMGVWKAFRRKGASKGDVRLLWIGVGFDVLATLMMSIQPTATVAANVATNPSFYIVAIGIGSTTLVLLNNLKTYLALLAMAGMIAGTILTGRAVSKGDQSMGATLSRVMVAPWALWVVVFVFGLIESMPKR
jgi:hypothetical protein